MRDRPKRGLGKEQQAPDKETDVHRAKGAMDDPVRGVTSLFFGRSVARKCLEDNTCDEDLSRISVEEMSSMEATQ